MGIPAVDGDERLVQLGLDVELGEVDWVERDDVTGRGERIGFGGDNKRKEGVVTSVLTGADRNMSGTFDQYQLIPSMITTGVRSGRVVWGDRPSTTGGS